jgi:hypothetical protein
MNNKKIVTSLATLVVLLALLLTMVAYAQEPAENGELDGEIGGLGLADPPPSGLSVLYMFTGVANHNTPATRQIATSIHCTNFGSTAVQTELQLFAVGGSAFTTSVTINSNRTWTFSTQSTAIYREDSFLNTGTVEQGSGRVLADKAQLICTAQVLDPIGNPPTFMAKLPIFDSSGDPIGSIRRIFLPIILKQ